jgi:hypothetical protein
LLQVAAAANPVKATAMATSRQILFIISSPFRG